MNLASSEKSYLLSISDILNFITTGFHPTESCKTLVCFLYFSSLFEDGRLTQSCSFLCVVSDRQELRNGGKRVNSLSGIGGKLNSLLRNKKQKRTRSGIAFKSILRAIVVYI